MTDTPRSSDDRRELEEAAADLGVTVDELERRRLADARARAADIDLERPLKAAPASPDRFRHDPDTIERGRRHIAAIRDQLAQRAATRPEEVTP